MKHLVTLSLLMMLASAVSAQSNSDLFYDSFNNDDLAAQRAILKAWALEVPPLDADFYIASYNYYANRAVKGDEDGNVIDVNQQLADSALFAIEDGVGLYPNRLDIRFGKIFFLGQVGRWDEFVDEILRTLDHSEAIAHKWVFPNVDNGLKELLQEGMTDYMSALSGQINWDAKPIVGADTVMVLRLRKVAKAVSRTFLRDLNALNTVSATYMVLGQYEKALTYLERAEKMAPTDDAVLRNLYEANKKLGRKKEASHYLDRLRKSLDPAVSSWAKRQK